MKRNRHGKGKILSQAEIQLLFTQGLHNLRDRCIFAVCLFSGCRINEACTLLSEDVYTLQGIVRSHLTIRKSNTKGKLSTRTIPIIQDLRLILAVYYPESGKKFLFPGRYGSHIDSDSAARIFRMACQRVGIEGASTHSFRRTALTQMSDANIPLRVIAEVSGHRNLTQLQTYLEVRPEQVLGAVSALSMLSPTGVVGKITYDDIEAEKPLFNDPKADQELEQVDSSQVVPNGNA
ncbi:integrase family protein (plasmid) [Crinalium epipsammum PCC 9333]|uniref:Integrase family protein n=1 Tax=Crinalium epipsammum PCC 9333 TaxID=1173022 RepID=K9W7J8_9CYAN|nr:site-specific integrase [Crinalium epipsammum]AFZ15712.1 integrase family protein [Crinalium epipsammum PCC 9333]